MWKIGTNMEKVNKNNRETMCFMKVNMEQIKKLDII